MDQPLNQQVVVVIKQEYDDIPHVNTVLALFILILNCILPGWGTMLLAIIGGRDCCGWFFKGVLQFLLAVIIVGWVWSIITGCQVLSKSKLV